MTPSNPTNSQPLIYRIADALGVFHLVAPVNHTHTYAEVPGLADDLSELWAGLNEKANQEDMTEALAAKQDALTFDTTPTANSTNPVTSGGVKAALDEKRQIRQDDPDTLDHAIVAATASDGDIYILLSVREDDNVKSVHITPDNMENLIRALITPDSTPTASSDNLVTSGGVAAAVKDARKVILNSNIPYVMSVAEKGVLYTSLFTNRTGAAVSLSECFDVSGLPTAERNICFNVAADSIEIANNETFGVRFLRTTSGVFVWYDGLFEF